MVLSSYIYSRTSRNNGFEKKNATFKPGHLTKVLFYEILGLQMAFRLAIVTSRI